MKYTPRIVKRICQLIESDDYTISEICQHTGINPDTYYDWKKNKPEFSDALKKADEKRLEAFKKAARSGLLTLLQGKDYEEVTTEYTADPRRPRSKPKIKLQRKIRKFILPNPTSVIFALKNLDPDNFAEIFRQEHTGKDGSPLALTVTQLKPEEIKKIAESLENEV